MKLEVKSPWNLELLEEIPLHSEKEIESICQKAYETSLLKGLDFPISERIKVLESFSKSIRKDKENLAKLASTEGGKPLIDSIVEIERGAEGVDSTIEVLKSEAGSVIPMNLNKASSNRLAFTQKEPIGLVLVISAFNHPFNLIIHQLIPAIASGCSVMVKPAEDTPLSCIQIIKILKESGLPSNRCFCNARKFRISK